MFGIRKREDLQAVAVVVALVIGYQYSSLKADVEIARVTAELTVLQQERVSVEAIAQRNDSLQSELSGVKGELRAEVSRRQEVVTQIVEESADTVFAIRSLRRTSEIADRFADVYPEITAAPWGVQDVYFEDLDMELEMIMIHSAAMDQFMIEHERARALRLQVDTLQTMVQLQDSVQVLSDSILVLESQTRSAFEGAYNNVFDRYTDLNGRYVNKVAKPKFGINVPTLGTIIAAGAVGLLIGNQDE